MILLHKTVFAADRQAGRLLAKNGTTFSDFLILTALFHCKTPSQSGIAAFLDLSPAAVSRKVDGLVRAGLAKREADPVSRRSHVVRLTAHGIKEHIRMKNLIMKEFGAHLSKLKRSSLTHANEALETLLFSLVPEAHDCQFIR